MNGERVLVTRPLMRAGPWIEALTRAGAAVVHLPLWKLDLPAPTEWAEVVRCLQTHAGQNAGARGGQSWLTFTSAAAVEHFMTIIEAAGERDRLTGLQVASIGPATSDACQRHGLHVTLVAPQATSAALGSALLEHGTAPQVLHPTSSMAREELGAAIHTGGGTVAHCVVTVASPNLSIDAAAVTAALEGLAAATFASPAAVQRLLELAPESHHQRLRTTPAVAIGATTENTLHAAGFEQVVAANSPRVEDVLAAVRSVLVS